MAIMYVGCWASQEIVFERAFLVANQEQEAGAGGRSGRISCQLIDKLSVINEG